jgi:hypothetical protein
MKFMENEDVYKLVKEKGREILPITTINGKILKTEDYPALFIFFQQGRCR